MCKFHKIEIVSENLIFRLEFYQNIANNENSIQETYMNFTKAKSCQTLSSVKKHIANNEMTKLKMTKIYIRNFELTASK